MEITLTTEQLKYGLIGAYGLVHILFGLITHHRFVSVADEYNKQNEKRDERKPDKVSNTDMVMLFIFRMLFGLPNRLLLYLIGAIWACLYLIGWFVADTLTLMSTRRHLVWKNLFIPRWVYHTVNPKEAVATSGVVCAAIIVLGCLYASLLFWTPAPALVGAGFLVLAALVSGA